MVYSDVHRLFVQVMMSDKYLRKRDAFKKYQAVQEALGELEADENDQHSLQDLVREINKEMSLINLEIREGICEVTSKKYYLLVNTVAMPINLTHKKYSETELEAYKKIIDEIVSSENSQVSAIDCMNVEVPNMSKTAIEVALKKLVADGWLGFIAGAGMYYLTVRSITELGPYLKSIYKDDINACELCTEIIFQGYQCRQCDTMIHRHCLKTYAGHSEGSLTCPRQDCRSEILITPRSIGTVDEAGN